MGTGDTRVSRAPTPADEPERLRALAATRLLDSPPDAAFDAITRAAAHSLDVPIAWVTLLDVNRQWWKSCHGVTFGEAAREDSFCAYAILGEDLLVIPDALADTRFRDNPFVVGEPGIRFYAGAPLRTADGHSLGTLCIVDTEPRAGLDADERTILVSLARAASELLEVARVREELRIAREQADEAAESLRRADAVKNLFLTAASHDLRSKVAAIFGFGDILARDDGALPPDKRKTFAKQIVAAARTLQRMLDDLLDLNRLSQDAIRPRLEHLDLGALVHQVCAENRPSRSLHIDAPPLRAVADRTLIERALGNLLANAEKHTPQETNIWVRLDERDEGILLSVEDDGPGVPPDAREEIFEAFRRGPAAAGRPGSGIGLHLVARFAQLHGGRAWAEERAGGGSAFRLWIPRLREEAMVGE